MIRVIICVLLVGCNSPHLVEPDGCSPNPNFETIEHEKVCVDSIRCVEDGVVRLSNYACFCDGVCLCFFSVTDDCELSSECKKHSGMMAILSLDFCLLKGKTKILQELNNKVDEMT